MLHVHVLCHVVLYYLNVSLCRVHIQDVDIVFPIVNQAPEAAAKPIALYTWFLCFAIREVAPVSFLTALGKAALV